VCPWRVSRDGRECPAYGEGNHDKVLSGAQFLPSRTPNKALGRCCDSCEEPWHNAVNVFRDH